jgi:hypothetical protein
MQVEKVIMGKDKGKDDHAFVRFKDREGAAKALEGTSAGTAFVWWCAVCVRRQRPQLPVPSFPL